MKKVTFLILTVCWNYLIVVSQTNVSQGPLVDYQLKKQTEITSFTKDNDYYFVLKYPERAQTKFDLIVSDPKGNILQAGEIKIDLGVFNNMNEINSVVALENKLIVLIENRNKEAGKSYLMARTMDHNGNLDKQKTDIGVFEFKKMMNSGTWMSYVTPDKNHLVIVGQLPFEKEEPHRKFKFYFLDSDLKKLNEGAFELPGEAKRFTYVSLFASDKGDIYLIKNDNEKGAIIPIVYKASVLSPTVSEFTVSLNSPQRILNYSASLNAMGVLELAGYYNDKSISFGEIESKGTWIYDSKENNVKSFPFDKPISNTMARGIVNNGNTLFLIGEQYKEDKKMVDKPGGLGLDDDYTFTHKNLLVTGFDNTNWSKKYDMVMNRNWTGYNFNQDIMPAYGVLNGKLILIYNDQYNKYFPKVPAYSNYKLPVLVSITNDGLMEQPISFEKQFYITENSFTLYPKFFNNGNQTEMAILGGNYKGVKGVIFSIK